MAHYSGKDLYMTWDGTVMDTDARSLDINETLKLIDTTAGADVAESHVIGTKGCTCQITLLYNGTADATLYQKLYNGNQETLIIGPQGNTAGYPKYSGTFTLSDFNEKVKYGDSMEYTFTLTRTGDWAESYRDSGDTF